MRDRTITKFDQPTKPRSSVSRKDSSFVREGNLATIDGVVVRPIESFVDERGWLMEVFRHDELPADLHPTMAYVSLTNPGVVRGPHEHVDQTDLFAFVGPGEFAITLWDARTDSTTSGEKEVFHCGASQPHVVVVPPGVVHAYKNISDVAGMVFNAPNRLYAGEGKTQPVDEIRHESIADSPYAVE